MNCSRVGLDGMGIAIILLVDDFPDACEMYTHYLKYSGFKVVKAANGIDIILLMDRSLPVMDGWEATRRLKAHPGTAKIPVVAFTAHALAGTSDAAKQAGCDAFVTKPCLPEDLVKKIRKVLAEGGNP